MGRGGGIKNQLAHVISQTTVIDGQKRSLGENRRLKSAGYTRSVQTADNLRATANQFAEFMKKNHPEVRLMRDVKDRHIQAFLNDRSKNWSKATCESKISDMRVLMRKSEVVFGKMKTSENLQKVSVPMSSRGSTRDRAIEPKDIQALRDSFKARDAKTAARTALELSSRFGLRSKEAARLNTRNIDLKHGVIHLTETKGGKWRDVPIRPKDLAYITNLKEQLPNNTLVCHGTRAESLNAGIRREMQTLGISEKYPLTTEHALRKAYARERFQEELGKGLTDREAWTVVQQELGHGDHFREELFETYIGK